MSGCFSASINDIANLNGALKGTVKLKLFL